MVSSEAGSVTTVVTARTAVVCGSRGREEAKHGRSVEVWKCG